MIANIDNNFINEYIGVAGPTLTNQVIRTFMQKILESSSEDIVYHDEEFALAKFS